MAWIIGLIAIIGFGYLMYVNQSFRRFGTWVIVVFAIAVGVVFYLDAKQSRDYEAKRNRQMTAISASQLAFSNLQLFQDEYGWRVNGNVFNRSNYPLRSFTMRVYLQECAPAPSDQGCITTGQDDARFYVDVPPGQARQLSTTVQLADAATLGQHWSWNYLVREVEAVVE